MEIWWLIRKEVAHRKCGVVALEAMMDHEKCGDFCRYGDLWEMRWFIGDVVAHWIRGLDNDYTDTDTE